MDIGRCCIMKETNLIGGEGTRLYPLIVVMSKQFLSVYDKSVIQYPFRFLMFAGSGRFLLSSPPQRASRFEILLGNGNQLGIELSYCVQPSPSGFAHGILVLADEAEFFYKCDVFITQMIKATSHEMSRKLVSFD